MVFIESVIKDGIEKQLYASKRLSTIIGRSYNQIQYISNLLFDLLNIFFFEIHQFAYSIIEYTVQ